ncbi:hypothetical protein BDD12DRAFT_884162 [Trichophaea hybrida]|nr:hypothetical protein BDD12DRAFT_884162 [Trichophaea hybrida]
MRSSSGTSTLKWPKRLVNPVFLSGQASKKAGRPPGFRNGDRAGPAPRPGLGFCRLGTLGQSESSIIDEFGDPEGPVFRQWAFEWTTHQIYSKLNQVCTSSIVAFAVCVDLVRYMENKLKSGFRCGDVLGMPLLHLATNRSLGGNGFPEDLVPAEGVNGKLNLAMMKLFLKQGASVETVYEGNTALGNLLV